MSPLYGYTLAEFVGCMHISFSLLMLQLEECAIQLWNWAVTKNVGTTISKNQKAKGTLLVAVFIYMIILLMIMTLENTHTYYLKCWHNVRIASWGGHGRVTSHSNVFTILTVRHVACSLLYCFEPENPTEGVIRKQILVSNTVGIVCECSTFQEDKVCLSVSDLYRWPAKQGEPGWTAKIPRWRITS